MNLKAGALLCQVVPLGPGTGAYFYPIHRPSITVLPLLTGHVEAGWMHELPAAASPACTQRVARANEMQLVAHFYFPPTCPFPPFMGCSALPSLTPPSPFFYFISRCLLEWVPYCIYGLVFLICLPIQAERSQSV